jgi:hypothetical protein
VLLSFGENDPEKKLFCSNSLFSDPIDFDKAQAASFTPVSARDYLPLRKAICPPTHFNNEDKQQFCQNDNNNAQ